MSAKDNGGSAFPWCGDLNDCPTIQLGMTLRDYFAAKALSGMLDDARWGTLEDSADMAARVAYKIADAMLLERAK